MYTNHMWRFVRLIVLVVLLAGTFGARSVAVAAPSINNYKQPSETLKSDKGRLLEQLGGQCVNAEQVRNTKDSNNIFRFVGTEPGKPISQLGVTTQSAIS